MKRQRDRADDRLERVTRQGLTWEEHVAIERDRATRGHETRKRRALGLPDPPPPIKRSSVPARIWKTPDGRVALTATYRPNLLREIHARFPGSWWSPHLCSWLVAAEHARAAVELLRLYYEYVSIDVGTAELLGFVVLDPRTFADPPSEEENVA